MHTAPSRRVHLALIAVFQTRSRRLRQFPQHEKQRFAVSHKSERFGTSEDASPTEIVVVHTGELLDCGDDAPVLLAAAFVGTGRQMVLDRSVLLIAEVLVHGLDQQTADPDCPRRVARDKAPRRVEVVNRALKTPAMLQDTA